MLAGFATTTSFCVAYVTHAVYTVHGIFHSAHKHLPEGDLPETSLTALRLQTTLVVSCKRTHLMVEQCVWQLYLRAAFHNQSVEAEAMLWQP